MDKFLWWFPSDIFIFVLVYSWIEGHSSLGIRRRLLKLTTLTVLFTKRNCWALLDPILTLAGDFQHSIAHKTYTRDHLPEFSVLLKMMFGRAIKSLCLAISLLTCVHSIGSSFYPISGVKTGIDAQAGTRLAWRISWIFKTTFQLSIYAWIFTFG